MQVNFSFKEHFGLNKKEQKGYIAFLLLLCVVTFGKQWRLRSAQTILVQDAWSENIDSTHKLVASKRNAKEFKPVFFDPNTCVDTVFEIFGAPNFIASRIVKYRNAGGRFKKPEDLKRIYGLSEAVYGKMRPYIRIVRSRPIKRHPKPSRAPKRVSQTVVNINVADSAAFTRLKGIGRVYASRIIKFRRLLGGYYSVDQLKDVYGVSDSLFLAIKPYLLCSGTVERIPLNKAELKDLYQHPYCDYKTAKILWNYRNRNGLYTSSSDITSVFGLDSTAIKKFIPYLSFN